MVLVWSPCSLGSSTNGPPTSHESKGRSLAPIFPPNVVSPMHPKTEHLHHDGRIRCGRISAAPTAAPIIECLLTPTELLNLITLFPSLGTPPYCLNEKIDPAKTVRSRASQPILFQKLDPPLSLLDSDHPTRFSLLARRRYHELRPSLHAGRSSAFLRSPRTQPQAKARARSTTTTKLRPTACLPASCPPGRRVLWRTEPAIRPAG